MGDTAEARAVLAGENDGPVCAEGELRGVTNAVPALISYFDRDLVCRFANGFHAEWYGGEPESIVGVHMRDFMGDIRFRSREEFIARALAGEQVAFDATVPHRDGSIREAAVRYIPKVDENGSIVGFYAMTFDVTDRARAERALGEQAEMLRRQIRHRESAEDQLRQLNETLEARVAAEIEGRRKTEAALLRSQKMESIGQLTGGIAHDFNNLLQIISSNLQLLEIDFAGDARAQRRITAALDGVARGSRLASQLLAFGRRQALAPRVLNITRLIGDMEDMLRSAIGSDIRVVVEKAPDLWNSFIDPAQLENVLLNLTINARDAMDGNGTLSVRLSNAMLDADYAAQHEDVSAGEYVMLALGDTGCGMTAEVMEKVFEPFFTTKPEHKGTGLGLSMVYGFVKQSGGHVHIESTVGVGTTIRLYLPRAKAVESVEAVTERRPVIGGSETVLVVEDDADVRVAAVEMLQRLGYRVLKAADAESGLAVVESGVPIDLLFSDVIMPGALSAAELARKARDHLPASRCCSPAAIPRMRSASRGGWTPAPTC